MTRRYYSQHGEDVLLWALLAESPGPRFFAEIGALDGRRFSNTLVFEEAGWRGLCVEAHPDYLPLLRRNRPGSVVIHAAVGAEDRDAVTFFANRRGSLSTLDRSLEEQYRSHGEYFTGWEERRVPMRSLTSLLTEVQAPCDFEVLSIDIEGTEIDALRGLDLARFQPRIILVEMRDAAAGAAMDRLLAPAGYARARVIGENLLYGRAPADVSRLHAVPLTVPPEPAAHPCDEGWEPGSAAGPPARGTDASDGSTRDGARVAPADLAAVLATEGWLAQRECAALLRLAAQARGGCIVEVGSYRGKSTVALALGTRRGAGVPVYAIEPHETFTGVLGGSFGPVDRAHFFRNMLAREVADAVRLVNLSSEVVTPGWRMPVALLWIDGDHRYEAVRRDFDCWSPHVPPGGIVAFHDATNPDLGPCRLIAELRERGGWRPVEQIDGIAVLRRETP